MAEQIPHKPALSCPHLGVFDDPDTSHSFPSTWNYCFHAKPSAVPSFEHQENFCLTADHVSCPVYQGAKGAAFPVNLLNTAKPPAQPQSSKRIYVYIVAAIVLLVLAGWLTSAMLNLPAKVMPASPSPAQGGTTIRTTATASAQPAATSIPTALMTPTPTPDLPAVEIKTPALETTFKIGDELFLIHQVKDGEGLDYLAKIHNTTPAVLEATNYSLSLPILIDSIILIRPDTTSLDPAEPSFQPYQVEDRSITFDELAKKLNVDLVALKYYNDCADRCVVTKGDWVLIARKK